MNGNISFEDLSQSLQDSLLKTLDDKSPDELKALDWFTWETDYFIELKNGLFDKAA